MTAITCPAKDCDRTDFRRVVSGNYTAVEWIYSDRPEPFNFDEEDVETTMMDSMPWECPNHGPVPDELAEQLDDLRP